MSTADADAAATASETESSFEVRGPVVVAVVNPSAAQDNQDVHDETRNDAHDDYLNDTHQYIETDPANKQVLLEAHYLDLDRSAFFKLRIPVRLKRLDNTFLYFFVPLHSVSSLTWATDDAADLRLVQSKLNSGGGGGVTRLDFCLHSPGHLVVPAQDSLEPKKPATARVLDSLISLAAALSFSFYVPHTVFSKSRLQQLEAISLSTQPRATANLEDLQDLRSLYNGKGGKRWVPIDDTASTASDSAASTVAVDTPPGYGPPPPQYDEIAPITPEQKRHGKRPRHRVSSGSSDGSPARPSKRGASTYPNEKDPPAHSDEKSEPSRTTSETLFAQMEMLVRGQHQYIQQQQTHILQQQEHIKQQDIDIKRLLATTADLEQQVAAMQERLDETGTKVECLDAGVLELGQDLDEVKCSIPDTEEMVQDLGDKIEQEVREQVEQRLHDVFHRIGNVLTD